MTTDIVKGSLAQIAKDSNKSIAETFISAAVVILVDTSGSMSSRDSRGGRSRYEVACEELQNLQGQLPGKIAVISFSSDVLFCPSGRPFNYGNGTDMAKALNFARVADCKDMKFILISDGEPEDENKTLEAASKFRNHIDTIYVGPEGDRAGQRFLEKLAQASGGSARKDFKVNLLADNIRGLLAYG